MEKQEEAERGAEAEATERAAEGGVEGGGGQGETWKKTEEARRRVKEGIVEGESVVVTNILRVAVGYNAAAAHDGYAPGIKATFRSPPAFTGPRCTRGRVSTMTTGLCCCCCYRRRIAPVHCSPAHRLRVYRDRYSIPPIPLTASSPVCLIRTRCMIMHWLPSKERPSTAGSLYSRRNPTVTFALISPFTIPQSIVAHVFGFLGILCGFFRRTILSRMKSKKIFVKIQQKFHQAFVFLNRIEIYIVKTSGAGRLEDKFFFLYATVALTV